MIPSAFIALVLALQGAAQNPPNQVQPHDQTQKSPTAPPPNAPAVPTGIPDKYFAPPPGGGSAVAKVDGQPVYGRDVEALMWECVGPQFVEEVVTLVAVRQAAAKQNINVKQLDIENRLKEDLKAYDVQSKNNPRRTAGMSVEAFLQLQGYPSSRLYLSTEVEVTLDKIAEKSFRPDSFVKVSMMLFKPDAATPAANATAEHNATAALARIKAGTSKWDAEVAKSQMPPNYLSNGGLLGWLDEGTFPPDVMQKIKALQPGQISAPIKAEDHGMTNFEIFRVEQVGGKAVGVDLETLRKRYVTDPQEHKKLLESIRAAAKLERFPSIEPGATAGSTPPPPPPTTKPQGARGRVDSLRGAESSRARASVPDPVFPTSVLKLALG